VLGWGVGGIEAEAVMLGQPYLMLVPQVVGVRLAGKMAPTATATDLALTVTELLRGVGVVDRFVEYFGPGANALNVADRATVANMAPEYGATCGFFPVDGATVSYLRQTGRSEDLCGQVEAYCRSSPLRGKTHRTGAPGWWNSIWATSGPACGPASTRTCYRRHAPEIPEHHQLRAGGWSGLRWSWTASASSSRRRVVIAVTNSPGDNRSCCGRAGRNGRVGQRPSAGSAASRRVRQAITGYQPSGLLSRSKLWASTRLYVAACISGSGRADDLARAQDDRLVVAAVLSGNRN
jgi:hypothetical protein